MDFCNYLYNVLSLGLSIDDWISTSVVKEGLYSYDFRVRCQLYTTLYFTNRYCHRCPLQLNYIKYLDAFIYDAPEKEMKLIWYPIEG